MNTKLYVVLLSLALTACNDDTAQIAKVAQDDTQTTAPKKAVVRVNHRMQLEPLKPQDFASRGKG